MNNTPHLNFSENEWASYGPGSKKCLQLIFGNVNGIESEAIKYLCSTQMDHFNRLGITDPPMVLEGGKPGVSVVDIEHSLCEAAKYDRGTGFRSKWRSSDIPVPSNIPPKEIRRETPTHFSSFVARGAGESRLPDMSVEELEREATPLWNAGYENDDTEYEISYIVRERLGADGWEFKVRWKGWSPKHDSWLPESALNNAPLVLKAWKKTHPKSTTKVVKRRRQAMLGDRRVHRRKESRSKTSKAKVASKGCIVS